MGLRALGVSVFSAAICLTSLTSGSLGTSSAVGGHTGEIVFTSSRDGNDEIYVLRGSGSVQTRLTNNVVADHDPAFSADGVIAFVRETGTTSELWTVQPVTRQKRRLMALPGTASDPAWSPGGTRLAFTLTTGGNADIAVVSTTRPGEPVTLTNDPAADTEPVWSPDGSKIAFVSTRSGNRDIWVMANDGSQLQDLTADSIDEFDPDWGTDGRILFARTAPGGRADIWVMSATGGDARALIDEPANDVEPRWSPDQQRIAFATDQDGNYEIYIALPDGSHLLDASNSVLGEDRDPSWQTVIPTSALPAHGIVLDTGRICAVNGLRKADLDLEAPRNGAPTCGNGGNDTIYGGPGNDVLWGDAGNDTIYGDFGDDAIHGGPGNDKLYGGPGRDRIYGDGGNDTIWAKDGVAEAIYGGPGHNVAHVDAGDDVYDAKKMTR